MVRETSLLRSDLIWALVVHDGADARIAVPSMPGADRLSVDAAVEADTDDMLATDGWRDIVTKIHCANSV